MSLRDKIARRPLLAGIAGLLGVSVAGAVAYEAAFWRHRRYPPTQFDDLLNQLPDRDAAAKLGRAAIAQDRPDNWSSSLRNTEAVARELRTGLGKGSLAGAVEADIASGRLVDVRGWVLPFSLALAAVIAAETT